MDLLAALSLAADSAAADSFRIDDSDTCDLLRTETADAAIALSESPHCAFAVALNETTSTAKAATLTTELVWIVFNIPMLHLLSAIFCQFMSSSFATNFSPLHLRTCDW